MGYVGLMRRTHLTDPEQAENKTQGMPCEALIGRFNRLPATFHAIGPELFGQSCSMQCYVSFLFDRRLETREDSPEIAESDVITHAAVF